MEHATTTALAPTEPGATATYQSAMENIAAVEQLGEWFFRSDMLGCATPDQGKVTALACICEGMTPFQFARTYHIIGGRLSKRSDAQLADFRRIGGRVRWVKDGDDGKEAVAVFTLDGVDTEVRYTIDQARNAGLVKDKSAWVKDPGSMLRARCITKAIRMVAPEIVHGMYDPDEIDAMREPSRRVAEVPASATPATVSAEPAAADPVIDVESEPAAATEPQLASREQIDRAAGLAKTLGISPDKYAAGIAARYSKPSAELLTPAEADELIACLQAKIDEKAAAVGE